jgi:hypothetical protein
MGQHLVAAGYLIAVAGELVQRVVLDRLEVHAQGVLPRGVAFLGQLDRLSYLGETRCA